MRKILALLLLPAFFCCNVVISTEKDIPLTTSQQYELTNTSYSNYYQTLPTNPNVYEEVLTFSSVELDKISGKLSPNQPLKLTELVVNSQGLPLFKLSNGQFIVADKRSVYDDSILSLEDTNQIVWLKSGFSVYEKAYVNGVKKINTNLVAYSPVKILQIATTPIAQYAKIENSGWVRVDYLSDTDNRIEKVQEILTSRYNQADFSIYVKQLDTDKTAGINPDMEMYSASVTKLPILYYAQEKLNQGKFTLAQGLKYIQDVNDYSGAYDTEGSGRNGRGPCRPPDYPPPPAQASATGTAAPAHRPPADSAGRFPAGCAAAGAAGAHRRPRSCVRRLTPIRHPRSRPTAFRPSIRRPSAPPPRRPAASGPPAHVAARQGSGYPACWPAGSLPPAHPARGCSGAPHRCDASGQRGFPASL